MGFLLSLSSHRDSIVEMGDNVDGFTHLNLLCHPNLEESERTKKAPFSETNLGTTYIARNAPPILEKLNRLFLILSRLIYCFVTKYLHCSLM